MFGRENAAVVSRAVLSGALAACLFINPSIGAVTWSLGRKATVKKQVREHVRRGVEDGDLVVLHFRLEEARAVLRWEDSREFEYGGQMYDVVETHVSGDTISYACWVDEEETRLNDTLANLASHELGEAACPGEDEDDPGPPPQASHGAVVREGRSPNLGPFRFWRLSPSLYSSAFITPPTPPPWPA
jgi:hypothetical protein